jgi:Tol biopolymer transport system component
VLGLALVAVVLQLVSVSSAEVQADGHSIRGDISRNGRLVVFDSLARNLSRRARGAAPEHVYLRDRRRGTTRMVSLSSSGRTSNLADWQPSISPNGTFVAWCSTSTNLARPDRHSGVPWTGPGLDPRTDVFVRDLRHGITRRASDDRRGGMANNASCRPDVANDGDVAFESHASDLVGGDTNGYVDVFAYDWATDRVERASVSSSGRQSVAGAQGVAISADGRYVAFYTGSHLAAGDRDRLGDVYARDRRSRTTRLVSAGSEGCYTEPVLALSPRGRRALFECGNNLIVRDLASGRSVVANPGHGGEPAADSVSRAAFSEDGRTVVFCTRAKNLARGHGPDDDVVLRDLRRGTTTVLAHAGASIGCLGTIAVSGDGRTALFSGDAPGIVPADVRDPRQADLFVAAPLR